MTVTDRQELFVALKAIAEGYPVDCHYDQYIRIANPDFDEPWKDPYIIIDLALVKEILKG